MHLLLTPINYAKKISLALGCTCTHCNPWLRLCNSRWHKIQNIHICLPSTD